MNTIQLNGKQFILAPSIGDCISLKAAGIDLLGSSGESQLEKLIADPVAFMTILATLISGQHNGDDQYQMPALAGLMRGQLWQEVRVKTLGAFRDFFLDSGYPQLVAALDRYNEAAEAITKQVAASLESGPLRHRIDAAVADILADLETIGN